MVHSSILLPITGSLESLNAAELAWYLAGQTDSELTAQHVIDIGTLLAFLGIEKPGLIGSGPFLTAYETMGRALRDISDKLEDSYTARVSSLGIKSAFVVDEGDPVEEICKRARDHGFIVTGYHSRFIDYTQNCQVNKLALAELIVQRSPVPVLIVKRPTTIISRFAVFCSMDHVNKNWLVNCLKSAHVLGARCDLTFVASGNNEELPTDFLGNLKGAFPELESERVKLLTSKNGQPAEICDEHLADADNQSLVVLSTVDSGKDRITSLGECPATLLNRLSCGAVMLWPEESTMPIFFERDSSVAASKV